MKLAHRHGAPRRARPLLHLHDRPAGVAGSGARRRSRATFTWSAGGDPLLRESSYARRLPRGSTEGKPVFSNVTGLVEDLKARRRPRGDRFGGRATTPGTTRCAPCPGGRPGTRRRKTSGRYRRSAIDDGLATAGWGLPYPRRAAGGAAAGVLTDLCARLASRSRARRPQGHVAGWLSAPRQAGSPPLGEILGVVLRGPATTPPWSSLTKELGLKETRSGSTAAGTPGGQGGPGRRRAAASRFRQRRRQRAVPVRQGDVRASRRRPATAPVRMGCSSRTCPSPGAPARSLPRC